MANKMFFFCLASLIAGNGAVICWKGLLAKGQTWEGKEKCLDWGCEEVDCPPWNDQERPNCGIATFKKSGLTVLNCGPGKEEGCSSDAVAKYCFCTDNKCNAACKCNDSPVKKEKNDASISIPTSHPTYLQLLIPSIVAAIVSGNQIFWGVDLEPKIQSKYEIRSTTRNKVFKFFRGSDAKKGLRFHRTLHTNLSSNLNIEHEIISRKCFYCTVIEGKSYSFVASSSMILKLNSLI